jgi:uncharacterized protein YukE
VAAPYHYQASSLQKIIGGTQEALSRMDSLNSKVQASSSDIYTANNSQSGQLFSQGLQDWNQDFAKVRNALESLNGKVTGLLNQTTNTDSDATGQAR